MMNFREELFKDPPSKYRGAPFWSWNSKLDSDELLRQIDIYKEMGIGGFHIHPRTGLATEYLGKDFMEAVSLSVHKAKQEGMYAYLYDEDRWPSGAAGGFVTKDHKYRARRIIFTPLELVPDNHSGEMARFVVTLEDGYLLTYKRVDAGNNTMEDDQDVWVAYMVIDQDSPWFNNQAYVNTLDIEAIEKFIEVTHEKYYQLFGDEFGKTIPAIFTDEPQFNRKQTLKFSNDKTSIPIPFTDDFDESFQAEYSYSIVDHLPELVWELKDTEVSKARYHYHDHLTERFTSAFADTVGQWCEKHNIKLTGHMMEEPTLHSQTSALGEAMRSYRSFHIPGIDMLCDWREYTTAKQTQSAARQMGSSGVLSELYGVTNWDFDFRGHKLQGDWQAALGVTLRVHHLTWYSMNGEAKRDYPASIGYQSPWYKEYSFIENHFARLSAILSQGKAKVSIGVVHPVETYWLFYGPEDKTGAIRSDLDENFRQLTEWLLFGLLDFDFICESLLPSQTPKVKDGELQVGEMTYKVILVPNCITLRRTTFEILKDFKNEGGEIIFTGETPRYLDAEISLEVQDFVEQCKSTLFSYNSIMGELEKYREIDIANDLGSRPNNYLYQLREDAEKRWLFICNGKEVQNPDVPHEDKLRINIRGTWDVTLYDTLTGDIRKVNTEHSEGITTFRKSMYEHDSLLLLLEPTEDKMEFSLPAEKVLSDKVEITLDPLHKYILSEPNVLLLDMAEYKFDDGEWQEKDEILRIDNELREALGYPLRMDAWAQPWVVQDVNNDPHSLGLRFRINSRIVLKECYLALENVEGTRIFVNGLEIDKEVDGYYVDRCISKVKLPELREGENEIILEIDFFERTNVENCYVLGDFGVKVKGKSLTIVPKDENIAFGDYATQGLPFYTGNLTYLVQTNLDSGRYQIEFSTYRAALIKVKVDGVERGNVVFSPYSLDLGYLDKGKHVIEIISFGNRFNGFGAVHNSNPSAKWHGPNSWRTVDKEYSYEYQLKRSGVLVSPRLFRYS